MTSEAPATKPRPTARRGKAIGEIREDTLPILIHEAVLEEVIEYSERSMQREVGGFLLGGVKEGQRAAIEIRHFLPAASARSQAATLTFTHEVWSQMNREREERFPDEQVVGWHHTHPGFGIFLSKNDEFIHRHYFRETYQVALVVDPRRQELGFFQWRDGQIVDCGFVCLYA